MCIMARRRIDATLDSETIEYLKSTKNMSETIDKAVKLFKNSEIPVINPENLKLRVTRIG